MGIEGVAEVTDRMNTRLSGFREKFDAWTAGQVAHLDGMKERQDAALVDGENKVTGLMEQQKMLELQVGRVQQDAEVAKHELSTIQGGLDTLKAKAAVVPPKLRQRTEMLEQGRTELEQAERACQNLDAESCSKLEEHLQAVRCFTQRLGLELRNEDSTGLVMVFTCLDASNPARPHTLNLHVNGNEEYVVGGCEPVRMLWEQW